jgi:hypothetical protein
MSGSENALHFQEREGMTTVAVCAVRIIACVEDPLVIDKILAQLDNKST